MWAKSAKELFAAFVLGNGILDLIHPWEGGRPGAGFRDGTGLPTIGTGLMSRAARSSALPKLLTRKRLRPSTARRMDWSLTR